MVEHEALSPGTTVGGYTVEEPLGTGGFGVVYRARHVSGRRVAIKVSKRPAAALSTQLLLWQQNEIEILTRLHHPSLVEVLSYGFLADGRLYLAMELVEGRLLSDYLAERGRLETIEAIRLVRRIAEALAYCHESKVLHLDLKPGNILLTDPYEPRLKVLDFGLSRLTSGFQGAETKLPAGTLAYMAPEYILGQGERVGAKVDLYALGVLFYELLAGRLPVAAAQLKELIQRKQSGHLVPLDEAAPQVPAPVVSLVHSLLAPQPEHRYSSAAMLAARLKHLYYRTLEVGGSAATSEEEPAVAPELAPDDVPFVGRASEVRQLLGALEANRSGEGGLLVLVGETGVGKSRLVSELLYQPEVTRGRLLAYGRCRQLGDLVPYSPLREALGHLVGAVLAAGGEPGRLARQAADASLAGEAKVLLELVPELARLRHERSEHGPGGATLHGVGAELVGKALSHLLHALAASMPVVLVLEDVHWADEGSLALLAQLAQAPVQRTLVLCTSRPSERLPQGGALQRLSLLPLAPEENEELLSTLTGGASREVLDSLRQAVPLLSAGNPLVSAQVVRHLRSEGYLSRTAEGSVLLSARLREEYEPPDSVHAAVERTLELLEPRVLRVLQVAAVMDRHFLLSDLAELGLFTAEQVRAAVAQGEAQRVCWARGDQGTFVHDAIRERLVTLLEPQALLDAHRRIAHRLLARGASPGTLGYHLERAGEQLSAVRAFMAAAMESESLHDPVGAARHLERASSLLCALPAGAERNDLLVRAVHERVRIACLMGSTEAMLQYLEQAAALIAEKTPEQELALNSAYSRVYYVKGQFPKALEYSARCLSTQQHTPAASLYRHIPSNILGRALCGSGKFGPSIPVLTEACELAAEVSEPLELTHSEGLLGVALGYTGEYEQALRRVEHAAEVARQLGNPVRVLATYFYAASIAEARFRWEEGVQHTTELLAYSEEQGIKGLYLYVGTMFAGRHQFHLGRLERARLLLNDSLKLSEQFGIRLGLGWVYAYLGDVELVAGRMEEARAAYAQGLELGNAAQDELAAPLSLIGLAHHAALSGGGLEGVRRYGEEALARFRAVSNITALLVALQRYAESLEELGEGEAAARLREERERIVARLGPGEHDFWPRVVPAQGEQPALPPREYWRTAATSRPSQSGPVTGESLQTATLQYDYPERTATLIPELDKVHGS